MKLVIYSQTSTVQPDGQTDRTVHRAAWLQLKNKHVADTHYNGIIMSMMASEITGISTVYSTVSLGTDKKTSKLRITGLCEGNSPVTSEFPAQLLTSSYLPKLGRCVWISKQSHVVSLRLAIGTPHLQRNKCCPITLGSKSDDICGTFQKRLQALKCESSYIFNIVYNDNLSMYR